MVSCWVAKGGESILIVVLVFCWYVEGGLCVYIVVCCFVYYVVLLVVSVVMYIVEA